MIVEITDPNENIKTILEESWILKNRRRNTMKIRIIGILILSLALVLCACTPSSPPKPDDTGSDTESEKFKTESETKAESKPGSEEEPQMETGTCKLTFSSFDGGGYKYKVIIEDPEILTYEMKY